jgi:hypothetical protein
VEFPVVEVVELLMFAQEVMVWETVCWLQQVVVDMQAMALAQAADQQVMMLRFIILVLADMVEHKSPVVLQVVMQEMRLMAVGVMEVTVQPDIMPGVAAAAAADIMAAAAVQVLRIMGPDILTVVVEDLPIPEGLP